MSTENANTEWSDADIKKLKDLRDEGKTTEEIAKALGRTVEAIYNKASELGLSLLPKDK